MTLMLLTAPYYPHFFRPFEAMADYVRDDIKRGASPAIRRILALDHPYPIMKQ